MNSPYLMKNRQLNREAFKFLKQRKAQYIKDKYAEFAKIIQSNEDRLNSMPE